MKQLLKNNLYFLVPFIVLLLISTILIMTYDKSDLHILSNEFNSPFFNYFFKLITHLGNGAMIAFFSITFLFVKYRYTIIFLIGSLVTSGLVQLLKRAVFENSYRPYKYFELYESYKLHFIEGVNLHSLHSFPSGHSATAFNIFLMLALIIKNKLIKILLLFTATAVAYSRVYLSQHFLSDVVAGSLIGVVIMLITFWWSETWNKDLLENSLINRTNPGNN